MTTSPPSRRSSTTLDSETTRAAELHPASPATAAGGIAQKGGKGEPTSSPDELEKGRAPEAESEKQRDEDGVAIEDGVLVVRLASSADPYR